MRKIIFVIAAIVALSGCAWGESALPPDLGPLKKDDIVKAVQSGNLEAVKEEIASGADINTTFVTTEFGTLPRNMSLYEYATMQAGFHASSQIADLLLENGAEVNFLYLTGNSPLINAAGSNNVAECEKLLLHGADMAMQSKEGITVLDQAAQMGATDTLVYFMSKGAEPTQKTLQLAMNCEEWEAAHIVAEDLVERGIDPELDPIIQAAVLGDSETVVQYCENGALTEENRDTVGCYTAAVCGAEALEACTARGFNLNQENGSLEIAATCGNLETAAYMIERYPEQVKKYMENALGAAVQHDQAELVECLINAGAKILPDEIGYSVLSDAAKLGHTHILKLLIDAGQEMTHEMLQNAVEQAIYARQTDALKLLLPLKAWTADELNAFCMASSTMEQWKACLSCGAKPTEDIWTYCLIGAVENEDAQSVSYLLSKGVNPSLLREDGASALEYAVLYGFYDITELLIQHGADVNCSNGECVPLHYAAMHSTNLTRLLLENGAEVDVQTTYGDTPLMWAVKYGKPSTVALLLQAGADMSIQNADGETAKDLAEKMENEEMKRYFS